MLKSYQVDKDAISFLNLECQETSSLLVLKFIGHAGGKTLLSFALSLHSFKTGPEFFF